MGAEIRIASCKTLTLIANPSDKPDKARIRRRGETKRLALGLLQVQRG